MKEGRERERERERERGGLMLEGCTYGGVGVGGREAISILIIALHYTTPQAFIAILPIH